ncbi:methyltransferase domain-containing protein [Candidatus Uhrbacteria bacterium]|nr:methyltransferase domain-containing protein [Candidatus Uhrbacteria bacterium]
MANLETQKNVGYFDVRLRPDARRSIVWKEIVSYLTPWLQTRNKKVVEIAAGYCAFINAISSSSRTAIDIDPIVMESAEKGVTAHVSDLRQSWPQGPFDIVLASNFFEHLTNNEFEQMLTDIWRNTAPQAKLCIIQPNFRYAWREYFDDYTHKKIFTHEGILGILRASGWSILHVEPRFLPFSLKSSPGRIPLIFYAYIVRWYLRSPWRPRAGQMLIIAQKP